MKIQSIATLFLAVDFAVGGTIRNGSKSVTFTGSTDQEEEPDVGILISAVIEERVLATYRSGSCINGTDVCLRAGIGSGSFLAGDYTCIGDEACMAAGESGDFEAGNNCCNGLESCYGAGWAGSFVVGNSTCIGELSCRYAGSDGALSFTAGDHTCIGKSACNDAGSYDGGYFVSGSNSCYGDYSCLKAGTASKAGPYRFLVGNNACRGSSACREGGYEALVEIGDGSCIGTDSCRVDGKGKSFTIGKNSCQCDECCLYLPNGSFIGDNQCNDISDGCRNQTEAVIRIPEPSISMAPSDVPSMSPSGAPSKAPSSQSPDVKVLDCSTLKPCSPKGQPKRFPVCVERNLDQQTRCEPNNFDPRDPFDKVIHCGRCL